MQRTFFSIVAIKKNVRPYPLSAWAIAVNIPPVWE